MGCPAVAAAGMAVVPVVHLIVVTADLVVLLPAGFVGHGGALVLVHLRVLVLVP